MIARLTNMLAALVFVAVSALHMGMVLRDGVAGQYAATFSLITGRDTDIGDICGAAGSGGIDRGHCPFCSLSAHFIAPEPPVPPTRAAGGNLCAWDDFGWRVVTLWRWYLPEARGPPLLA